MPHIFELQMGVDCLEKDAYAEESAIENLKATIEHYLPAFSQAVEAAKAKGKEGLMMIHQDGWASGYDYDEYTLLGMAIKYAGLSGITIHVCGKNHETL